MRGTRSSSASITRRSRSTGTGPDREDGGSHASGLVPNPGPGCADLRLRPDALLRLPRLDEPGRLAGEAREARPRGDLRPGALGLPRWPDRCPCLLRLAILGGPG